MFDLFEKITNHQIKMNIVENPGGFQRVAHSMAEVVDKASILLYRHLQRVYPSKNETLSGTGKGGHNDAATATDHCRDKTAHFEAPWAKDFKVGMCTRSTGISRWANFTLSSRAGSVDSPPHHLPRVDSFECQAWEKDRDPERSEPKRVPCQQAMHKFDFGTPKVGLGQTRPSCPNFHTHLPAKDNSPLLHRPEWGGGLEYG